MADANIEQASSSVATERIMARKAIPRGVPGSNRTWKQVHTKRTSASSRPKSAAFKNTGVPFHVSLAKKQQRKAAQEENKRLSDERTARFDELKRKRLEKEQRKAEGEMRAAQVQNIDPAKMKKMNKKQLRQVKKTRVNAKTGVVELVNAYA